MQREGCGVAKAGREEGAGGKAQKLECWGRTYSGIQADTKHGGGAPL